MARVAHCFLSMERHWRVTLARNPMPIQIRCEHFIPPFSLWKSLQGPGISGVRNSLLAILWQDRVRIFQQPCLVSRGVSGKPDFWCTAGGPWRSCWWSQPGPVWSLNGFPWTGFLQSAPSASSAYCSSMEWVISCVHFSLNTGPGSW